MHKDVHNARINERQKNLCIPPVQGVRWVSKAQNGYIFTIFFFIYPMKYFIQTVYHIKDTYLISIL